MLIRLFLKQQDIRASAVKVLVVFLALVKVQKLDNRARIGTNPTVMKTKPMGSPI
jgi:hypothetical protein